MDGYRAGDIIPCSRCDARVTATDAFLSGDGPICERCHRSSATLDKGRHKNAEGKRDGLMAAVWAVGGGLGAAILTGLRPDVLPVKYFVVLAFFLLATVRGIVGVLRSPPSTLTRVLAAIGALLFALAIVFALAGGVLRATD